MTDIYQVQHEEKNMPNFTLFYHSGSIPKSEAAVNQLMDDWNKWVNEIGTDLVNPGTGLGKSNTVMSDGAIIENGGINPIAGYCTINADDMIDALNITKGHPYLAHGGSIEVAEAIS